ncbi:MAG: sialate O-acetylesterase [Planctomycetes bacterium B3_Pla]|nr:MAG: sialate O-acetylesterase [Planctomycetes bacterium B3_Pla]
MVLQRDEKVSIWGWADPGEEVMVGVSWISMKWAVTADKEGKWAFKMNSPKVGGPYQMTLTGKNEITIKNIMAGEVWVCSGQSNMQWSVKASANAEQEIADADYPDIRLFTVTRKVAQEPQSDCEGSWTSCSSETVPGFSAVAYFFGRELHKELGVPIGLIHTSWGGTPAEAWTRHEVLEAEADFEPILTRQKNIIANYPQAKKEFELKFQEWKQAVETAKAEGNKPPGRPREPRRPGHPHSPAGLYNAMIAPLIPYGIQGAIWYQGESNAGRAYQYRKLFAAMITNWRKDWGQGDFPFLFVQLANFKDIKPEPGESDWAELREAQTMALSLPNAGMATIIDIGEAKDIHPKNKQDVGKRLALWALGQTYKKKLVYSGPIYKSMKVERGKIRLSFNHVGGGLVGRDDEPLKGFAIAGANRKFVWADAEIDGETVVVGSDGVSRPVAVRYAWADNPVCNLYNKDGLPASPFRTDDWPGVTVDAK